MTTSASKKLRRASRTEAANSIYDTAKEFADSHGIELIQCTEHHYQMRLNNWIYDIWIASGLIRRDPHYCGPYINCPGKGFSLLKAVQALQEVLR